MVFHWGRSFTWAISNQNFSFSLMNVFKLSNIKPKFWDFHCGRSLSWDIWNQNFSLSLWTFRTTDSWTNYRQTGKKGEDGYRDALHLRTSLGHTIDNTEEPDLTLNLRQVGGESLIPGWVPVLNSCHNLTKHITVMLWYIIRLDGYWGNLPNTTS